jgi:hypothetical protein
MPEDVEAELKKYGLRRFEAEYNHWTVGKPPH